MKRLISILACVFLAIPVWAHRTEGLLQEELVDISPEAIRVEVTLAPGIDIAPKIVALLDSDGDSIFSDAELSAWSKLFMENQGVIVDGKPVPAKFAAVRASPVDEMDSGHAVIIVRFTADFRKLGKGAHQIVVANHYEPIPSFYQSNGLVPRSSAIRICSQTRDERQTELTLDTVFGEAPITASGHSFDGSSVSPQTKHVVPISMFCAAAGLVALIVQRRRELINPTKT